MTVTNVEAVRLHHIALTVSDIEASVEWYSKVFGVQHMMDAPHAGGVGRILADDTQSLMIALHAHDRSAGEPFDETRTGLDHVGFVASSREALERWQEHLASHGVQRAPTADRPLTQSPIADEPYGSVLVFRDRDNIQLEVFAPRPT
jgi:catechol 2,3-dioxygenase-like lactoylglutathione lyase family enzyme